MAEQIQQIPLARIHEDPRNPRQLFGDIAGLAKTIDEQGLIEPAVLRPHEKEGDFWVVAGARRFRAHQHLGRKAMGSVVRNITAQQALEIMVVENKHRDDINPIELAGGLASMRQDYSLTGDQIAERVELARTEVYDLLSLHDNLFEAAKRAVLDGKLGTISAIAISRVRGERLQNAALAEALKLTQPGEKQPPARAVKKLVQGKYLQKNTGTSKRAQQRRQMVAEAAAVIASRRKVLQRLLTRVAELVERKHHLDETDLRTMAIAAVETPPSAAATREVLERRGIGDSTSKLAKLGGAQLRSLVVELAIASFVALTDDGDYSTGTRTVAKAYGLTLAELEKGVEATDQAEALFKK